FRIVSNYVLLAPERNSFPRRGVRRSMVKPSREGLLKQRKALELALRELQSGKVKGTPGRLYRGSAEMGSHRLDSIAQRIDSVEKRMSQIDDQIAAVTCLK